MPTGSMRGQILRLAEVYDITTKEVVAGVELELPPGVPLPQTVEEAHAAINAYAAAVGPNAVVAVAKYNPPAGGYSKPSGNRHPGVEAAVLKVRALAASPGFDKVSAGRHFIDYGPRGGGHGPAPK